METEQPNIIELCDRSTESEGTPREHLGLSLNLLELSGHGMYPFQLKDDEGSDSSSACSSKSEKSGGSQGLLFGYQVSECSENGMSPTQSPPLQTMDRMGGFEPYDPLRIPSAVFQRNLSFTPLEWSVASNESLFSIHVGNTSFSRDHTLMLGADFGKSESTKADTLFVFNPPPPGVITTCVEFKEKPQMGDTIEFDIKDHEEGLVSKDASGRSALPPAVSWNSSSKSCRSNGSQRSSDSFAFPILADDEAHNGSAPVDGKKKHQNTQSTAVSSKSTVNSWFSCCSCTSCCNWSCCSCSYPSCCKLSCSYPSCCKRNCCSFSSSCEWNWCSFSSCCKWSCSSCSKSCCKWDCCSFSSCCKWSCSSCSKSCCKWDCCSFSSCCKWNSCSVSSCSSWSCSSDCFRRCRSCCCCCCCCCFRGCHYYSPCHICCCC